MDLTPQESEQLSQYVADDSYVKKQKEDIEELVGRKVIFEKLENLQYLLYFQISKNTL